MGYQLLWLSNTAAVEQYYGTNPFLLLLLLRTLLSAVLACSYRKLWLYWAEVLGIKSSMPLLLLRIDCFSRCQAQPLSRVAVSN
jgi:hypothetical protein